MSVVNQIFFIPTKDFHTAYLYQIYIPWLQARPSIFSYKFIYDWHCRDKRCKPIFSCFLNLHKMHREIIYDLHLEIYLFKITTLSPKKLGELEWSWANKLLWKPWFHNTKDPLWTWASITKLLPLNNLGHYPLHLWSDEISEQHHSDNQGPDQTTARSLARESAWLSPLHLHHETKHTQHRWLVD